MTAQCTICQCPATHEVYGFRVCEYHTTTGESGRPCPTCSTPAELAAFITYGALLEAGRPDLAELVAYHLNADGTPYLEPLDDVKGADLELMERAERLTLSAIGVTR